MKQLLTFNITTCSNTYHNSLTKDETTDKKPTFNLSTFYSKKSFLIHCTALFATIPLIKNDNGLISMKKTFLNISDMHRTSEGLIPGANLKDIIIFVANANRSYLAPIAAKKDPTLGGMTPLFMYAHKLYNNVEYSEWDKNDDYIQLALGKYLYSCWAFVSGHERVKNIRIVKEAFSEKKEIVTWSVKVNDELVKKPTLTHELVKSLREELQRVVKTGEIKEVLDFKMKANYSIDGVVYPANVLRMELQTWIANGNIRNDKASILDIWDWSSTPEPWDIVIEKTDDIPVDPGRQSNHWY